MKVSIIIPVYKVEQTIVRCLRSVAMQRFKGDIECVLIDDNTPDASMQIAMEFIANDKSGVKWILLKHEENAGLSVARNTGIEASSGEYLYFLDSDDEITPDCLSLLVSLAERYLGVDIVQGNLYATDTRFNCFDLRTLDFPEYVDDKKWIRHHILTDIPVMAWNRLYRHDWVVENGLTFEPGIIHEDEHWRYQAAGKIGSIAFCKTPTYIYHVTPGSITNTKKKDKGYLSMIKAFSDYLPLLEEDWMWRYMLLYLYEAKCHPERFNSLAEFEVALREFIELALRSESMPQWARRLYRYARKPSKLTKFRYYLFHHHTYKLIRRLGGSPY